MSKMFRFTARCLWSVSVIAAATTIGAMIGWHSSGWGGAVGFGLVGFGTGSALAAFPSFFLDMFLSFVFA
ncbi:hypothetical protein AB4Z34_10605 [Ensifer sp. 2YAB10]|uniref:hypothetical protein n=1 Tax=Ensifer TaxID=106591 RepID=UPI001CBCA8BC|nr:hypothetical protein [Ensifer adhaerens]MBZ7922325.1 hypothetical protein [Ensifer adhaerens]UAX90962.1 hypothetical protein LAC78_11060 [Ensifer adhaerens]UAX98591.1 hypothetical protein LAC80_11070 [Ensifer adhaerens]UAY05972.1 hypothetical protein LAC81_11065 [Ensifer adhaerens]